MNILANTHVSTVIFADIDRKQNLRRLIYKDFYRFKNEFPYLSISQLHISHFNTRRMFPHAGPDSIQQGLRVQLNMFRVPKVCWFLIGDPVDIYKALYPRFFSVPKILVCNDLPSPVEKSCSPTSLWEDFIEQANNNSNWVKPMCIRQRSAFIV